MDPLTYVASGFVRDFGVWLLLLVGLAAGVSVFAMLSLVMNMRRTMRAVERIAAAVDSPRDATGGRGLGI
jgi:hypothetical protein